MMVYSSSITTYRLNWYDSQNSPCAYAQILTMWMTIMLHASLNSVRHQTDTDDIQISSCHSREVHPCFQLPPDVSDVATHSLSASRSIHEHVRSLRQHKLLGQATYMLQIPLVCRGTEQNHAKLQQVFKHWWTRLPHAMLQQVFKHWWTRLRHAMLKCSSTGEHACPMPCFSKCSSTGEHSCPLSQWS